MQHGHRPAFREVFPGILRGVDHMLRRLKTIFLYENSIINSPRDVKAQIMEENRRFAIIWSIVQILYWGYCLFMSTRQTDFLVCRSIYAVSLVVCIYTLLMSLFVVPRFPWMIQFVSIAVDAAFLGAGVAIAWHLAPKTIIIFGSVLIVPVLFICDLLSSVIMLLATVTAFAIVGRHGMEPSAYSWALSNAILFSSLGLILGFFVNRTRYERYLFADSVLKLAELQTQYAYNDPLTGLHNRRAYSENMDRFALKMPPYCCVIMADINGLKEINDRLGHEAGDELIIGSAECLRQGFMEIDTIYRIGGDEFCVIFTDSDTDAGQSMKRTEEYCAGWKGKYVNGISLSYGWADSNDFSDLESIRKAADQRMYQFKRQYYISKGADRRRR